MDVGVSGTGDSIQARPWRIVPDRDQAPFEFSFPEETIYFARGRWYRIETQSASWLALAAWTLVEAWGKPRGRVIVFGKPSNGNPTGDAALRGLWSWIEFVETDQAEYGAIIYDPDDPRRRLTYREPLPEMFRGEKVKRLDEVISTGRNEATLRLILTVSDEMRMVEHGMWTKLLREKPQP